METIDGTVKVELNNKLFDASENFYADSIGMQEANNWRDYIRYFFNSPVVIYGYYVIFYAIFLLCISITHLVFFNVSMEPLEIILAIWVATFILEEIRQAWFNFSSTLPISERWTQFVGRGLIV